MDKQQMVIHKIDENVDQIHALIQRKIEIWSNYVLFSPLWWFGVSLTILPWIVWILVRQKESTDKLLYSGFFVMVISVILDVLGDQMALWHYRFNVIPTLPTYAPWDITLMPVSVMVLIQVKPKFSPLIKAVFFALITSYGAEPFFNWLKIYQPKTWHYTYSIPIQIIIYLVAYYFTKRNKFKDLS